MDKIDSCRATFKQKFNINCTALSSESDWQQLYCKQYALFTPSNFCQKYYFH